MFKAGLWVGLLWALKEALDSAVGKLRYVEKNGVDEFRRSRG